MEKRAFDLFVHGLKDMYDAENRLVDALERQAKDATDSALKDGFRQHLQQTRGQVRRLEKCFRDIDRKPSKARCLGIVGLIDEYKTFKKKQKPDAETLDAFAAAGALKVEHYEIAAYRSLVGLAGVLGLAECGALLAANMAEEQETAGELEVMTQALAARVAGVEPTGVIRQTAEAVGEGLKQGAPVAVGAADKVRERTAEAVENVGEVLERTEERGRDVAGDGSSSRSRTSRSTSRSSSGSSRSKRPASKKTASKSASKRSSKKSPAKKSASSTSRKKSSSGSRKKTSSAKRSSKSRAKR